ncbi:alkaline phosphatase family protein [Marivirga sp. S37H4]|uniref:Alkaline phosphatase family protein n=1 Tax=Marivirga aurantiaca TaxID=2802615 RepID=A0A934WXQ5_9BACT|nr:alkaline phosphatase PafA [Marivirga aurantiaca]MBK6265088.1 alkaline phosphatase family protein [Marivirga aurantiaca]
MKKLAKFLLVIICIPFACVQNSNENTPLKRNGNKPKLVVGIVIDQFRPDYLTRYAEHFSEDGFKRLVADGFYNKNTHFNYIPTYTGPGHASVYTGTTPATHGIIGNDWYDRELKKTVYCAGDTAVQTVGSESRQGLMSPHRMLSSTITDELSFATNFRSKVVGVAIKDRGSILPAGHNPTGAFWYDSSTGDFISSSYYDIAALPQWVQDFNARKLSDKYLDSAWTLSMEAEKYTQSTADDKAYETVVKGKEKAVFPYDLKELREKNGNFKLLPSTPFGNTISTDLAIAAIEGEQMGQDSITDFLALSYSSTDYIGHGFGPRSVEVQDTYLKLDQDIARLLNYLDETVGKDEYLIFVTSDHGCAEVPSYMTSKKMPAGYYSSKNYKESIQTALTEKYGNGDWLEYYSNEQFFLDHDLIAKKKIKLDEIRQFVVDQSLKLEGVAKAYSASDMQQIEFTEGIASALQMGYHFKRSGDVLLVLEPGWFHQTSIATTHGSGYAYDSHVPLIWFGAGIKSGESYKRQSIDDIAVTLSFLLETKLPNGATGEPVLEVLE